MDVKNLENANYLAEVREQYEHYPYPLRDPREEIIELKCPQLSSPDYISHYAFSGKRDFSKNFRILVAGGGTGDATIMLAEQLRDANENIVHLDISSSSIAVAKSRAKVRGLTNITWIHGSLLDAPRLLKGKFDYIDCSGVLHHLESPEAGLTALTTVLKDDGVIGLMLYAKYGREGVYQIQNLMRLLNKDELIMQKRIENCKTVLRNLPETNNYRHVQHILADIDWYGDVGIYDMFLHSQDRAYSIPEVYDFLASANLNLSHLFFDAYTKYGNNLYKIEGYIQDGDLLKKAQKLSQKDQEAAAELLHGKMFKHSFYASRNQLKPPEISDLDNVPFFWIMMDKDVNNYFCNSLREAPVDQRLNYEVFGIEVFFTNTPNLREIFRYMDGKRSLGEIFQMIRDAAPLSTKPSLEELAEEMKALFEAFNLKDLMLLRHKSIPPFRTSDEIQRRKAI